MTLDISKIRLIQRLEKPFRGLGEVQDNPFAFGGGLKNGGLSDDAMSLLRGIFSFDYMGAAEFEFGAVPKALQRIAQYADEYRRYTVEIPLSKVKEGYRQVKPLDPTAKRTVYIICREADRNVVVKFIQHNARSDGFAQRTPYWLKEVTNLSAALRGDADEYPTRVCGWLELGQGFFFFTDQDMFEDTAELFGIER